MVAETSGGKQQGVAEAVPPLSNIRTADGAVSDSHSVDSVAGIGCLC